MDLERIIFIGGSGRSGTTLLASLLDLHPDIASVFEVHGLIPLLDAWRKGYLPDRDMINEIKALTKSAIDPTSEFNWRMLFSEVAALNELLERPITGRHSLVRAIKDWTNYIHLLQMARDGSNRIVHKTPVLGKFIAEVYGLWKDAFFIHVFRDPRDVIASYLAMDWGPKTVDEGIVFYIDRVKPVFAGRQLSENYIEICFEKLLLQPEEVLKKLFDKIQVSADPVKSILKQKKVLPQKIGARICELSDRDARKIYQQVIEDEIVELKLFYKLDRCPTKGYPLKT